MPDKSPLQRVLASPKAKRLAKTLGLDLAGLTGTGPDGLITTVDVQNAVDSRSTLPAPDISPDGREEKVYPLSKLRQTIAARMQTSKQTVPHFYLLAQADMSRTQQLRSYCRDTLGWDHPPTYTDIIVRACALALAALPELNIYYTDEGLVQRSTVDIGVAVSIEDGLVVPTLPQADRLSLRQTSTQLRDLITRTRTGRLREADLGPKSVVVSNLGMYPVDAFLAIIDMPAPLILAVGQVADQVVPMDGQPAVRPMCALSLSVDHRALDGVEGAQFITRVKSTLESPFEILRTAI